MREDLVKIIEYKDIGKVSFIRRNSIRNLKITIKPFKGVLVSVPAYISLESACKFVEEKSSWIRKSQLKLDRYEKRITRFEEDSTFNTRDYTLILARHTKSTIRTEIGKGRIKISFPDFADIRDPRIQKVIRKAVIMGWRLEAKKYLPERVSTLSKNFKLNFSRIIVRENKTRWGSCSRDNNISLNIHLMRLPEHLSDYVILHELAHTVHKHHQKAFWDFLNGITGGKAKEFDKELNHFSPEVW